MFLKIQWKTPKPHALSPEALLKKISVQVYSCEDFKLLKNTFFTEHLRMTASAKFYDCFMLFYFQNYKDLKS